MVAGANFALNVVLARWLSPDAYGGFAVMYSLFLFIAGLHNAMILEPMNVLGASRSTDALPRYFGALLWVQMAILAGLSGVLSLTAVVTDSLYQSLAKPLLGLGLALPWLLFFWFFRQVCYLKMKPSLACYGGLAYLIFVTVGLVLLRLTSEFSAFSAFIILGLSSAAATLVLWRLLISIRSGPSLRTADPIYAVLKDHWNYGRWVLGSTCVYALGNLLYVPLVSAFAGLSQAGALKAMQNLVAPVQQLLTAFNLLWLPWTAKQTQETDKSKLRRTFLAIVGSMSLAVIGYALLLVTFVVPLMSLLYGQGTYSQYNWIIPYWAVALVIGGINNGLMLILKALRRPDQVLFSLTGSALVTLTAGVYLVWQFGIFGVALGWILSATTATFILARQLSKSTVFAKESAGFPRKYVST
jgi:O-antigen/teichoic acid export membrane protein